MKEQSSDERRFQLGRRGLTRAPVVLPFGAQAMEFAFITALRADDSFWRRWTTKEFVCCITATI